MNNWKPSFKIGDTVTYAKHSWLIINWIKPRNNVAEYILQRANTSETARVTELELVKRPEKEMERNGKGTV